MCQGGPEPEIIPREITQKVAGKGGDGGTADGPRNKGVGGADGGALIVKKGWKDIGGGQEIKEKKSNLASCCHY